MDSIGMAVPPKMETWMVDMLFGLPGQATAETSGVASTAAPAVSVASSARSAVAPGTGQAIAALQAGGAVAPSDPGPSDSRSMTVAQANALVASNNAMTSAQISKVLYGGGGLQGSALIGGPSDTFASMIQRDRDGAQLLLSEAENGGTPYQDPASLRQDAAQWTAYTDSMQKAFDNHTLVIQKMSDVPGLNYVGYETFGGSPDQDPTSGTWTESYDKSAMNDFRSQFLDGNHWGDSGRHWGDPGIGGVRVLMTWTAD